MTPTAKKGPPAEASPSFGASPVAATENPHRLLDVLDLPFPQKLEATIELRLHMIKCGPGNANAGWLGQALQPRSYVNAVAEDVISLYNNIA